MIVRNKHGAAWSNVNDIFLQKCLQNLKPLYPFYFLPEKTTDPSSGQVNCGDWEDPTQKLTSSNDPFAELFPRTESTISGTFLQIFGNNSNFRRNRGGRKYPSGVPSYPWGEVWDLPMTLVLVCCSVLFPLSLRVENGSPSSYPENPHLGGSREASTCHFFQNKKHVDFHFSHVFFMIFWSFQIDMKKMVERMVRLEVSQKRKGRRRGLQQNTHSEKWGA